MRTIIFTFTLLFATITNAMTTVTWETLGNEKDQSGNNCYVQRFTIKGLAGVDRICFNQFARSLVPVLLGDTIVEIVPGYYYIKSDRMNENADSVVVDILTRGIFTNECYAPDGVHAVMNDGKTADVQFILKPIINEKSQWSVPEHDLMPYGDTIYRFNETLRCNDDMGVYDIIPSFKSVKLSNDGYYTGDGTPTFQPIKHENNEYYRITLNNNDALIEYSSPQAKKIAEYVFDKLYASGSKLPNVVISDYPDLPYRGVMIDIARNFQNEENLLSIVRLLADYRFNTLHLHFVDDEAWRIEIPGLPELVDVGSRRGYTLDEQDYLAQLFAGNGDPNTSTGTANGYWTRAEFMDFIKQCDSLGIAVIPEIESPGHARAAIKAMEARYQRLGDDTYRLIEKNDTSQYSSAQAFHDNVMNPVLPGPYRFMEKVIDEIELMYREAGVPLVAIHIGGDEVPRNAWNGSPTAIKFMAENNIADEKALHAYFVRQIAKILKEKNIPMNGWQEVAVGHSAEFDSIVAPLMGGVNCWTLASAGIARQAVDRGYPVIISNVNKFYLDQCYNYHPNERGLTWGGTVDEFVTLSGYVDELCPIDSLSKGKVIGVQGQLFSETLRSLAQLQYFLLPKMLGLAERAWNITPTYTQPQFNHLIETRELPSFASQGLNFHLRQPGIVIEDGMVKMNSPYEDAEIHYTLDGSEPSVSSPIYTQPFSFNGSEIRARLYYLGKESVTTILFTEKPLP